MITMGSVEYKVIGDPNELCQVWLRNMPRPLFDAFPVKERMYVPDDNREPTYYLKTFHKGKTDFYLHTLEDENGNIEGVLLPENAAQQVIARDLLPSGDFADDFDHEQLGMLPKDAIPQAREF